MNSLPDEITALRDEQVEFLEGQLCSLIEHRIKGIEYAEGRRSVLVAIAGALLAGSIALLTLVLGSVEHTQLKVALVTLSACWMFVSIVSWLVYGIQTNFNYPFTSVTKTWKWFYRNSLPDYEKFAAPWHGWQTKKTYNAATVAYNEQWPTFVSQQTSGLSDPRVNVYQDLQQLYLLHVNERYKNLFLTQLRQVMNRGLLASVVIATAAFVFSYLIGGGPASVSDGSFKQGQLTVESTWRDTGAVRESGIGGEEVQLILNVRVHNEGPENVGFDHIMAEDNFGLRIPMFVESIEPYPVTIAANAVGEFVATV